MATGIITNTKASPVKFTATIAGNPEIVTLTGYASIYTTLDAAGPDFAALVKQGTLTVTGTLATLVPDAKYPIDLPQERERTPTYILDLLSRLNDIYVRRDTTLSPGTLVGFTVGTLRISARGLELQDTATGVWRLINFKNGEITYTP